MAEKIKLSNGIEIPRLFFGTYKLADSQEAMDLAIKNGLDAGYRGIDTAEHYGNEEMVGKALRNSGYDREELFLTTKIWNTDHGYERTLEAFEESEKRLGTYVDMLLIHWPCPMKGLYTDTWRALQKLYEDKRVSVIGVSNFKEKHLEVLKKAGGMQPMVNQVEMHPYFVQEDLMEYCGKNRIAIQAWSPFLRGKNVAEHELIQEIGRTHNKSPAQIVLRYLTQLGAAVTIKTSSYEHALANRNIFDFCLTKKEMEELKTLNAGKRIYQDPDEYYL